MWKEALGDADTGSEETETEVDAANELEITNETENNNGTEQQSETQNEDKMKVEIMDDIQPKNEMKMVTIVDSDEERLSDSDLEVVKVVKLDKVCAILPENTPSTNTNTNTIATATAPKSSARFTRKLKSKRGSSRNADGITSSHLPRNDRPLLTVSTASTPERRPAPIPGQMPTPARTPTVTKSIESMPMSQTVASMPTPSSIKRSSRVSWPSDGEIGEGDEPRSAGSSSQPTPPPTSSWTIRQHFTSSQSSASGSGPGDGSGEHMESQSPTAGFYSSTVTSAVSMKRRSAIKSTLVEQLSQANSASDIDLASGHHHAEGSSMPAATDKHVRTSPSTEGTLTPRTSSTATVTLFVTVRSTGPKVTNPQTRKRNMPTMEPNEAGSRATVSIERTEKVARRQHSTLDHHVKGSFYNLRAAVHRYTRARAESSPEEEGSDAGDCSHTDSTKEEVEVTEEMLAAVQDGFYQRALLKFFKLEKDVLQPSSLLAWPTFSPSSKPAKEFEMLRNDVRRLRDDNATLMNRVIALLEEKAAGVEKEAKLMVRMAELERG
ncbi:hypothetical protein A1O1_06016 [Capronia coronata CBS 617.96]|uniref:Uncharacterized protein n=1 Tax=Capronia coronata CBS 617.96 TaxID=1182541 RepID=W9Y7N2_9EURO|nr:uncharacterized protein A1O1_06016 [Capronia coronata CBS 617.96]EXJ85650.1 hypothetical protein A1O1_06016 [Capronia coronata CBS 617.96]